MLKNVYYPELFLYLIILSAFNSNIYGQALAQISIPFDIYDNSGGQKTLYFGLDETATDGIDVHLEEIELPPYPPTGIFDARWILPENGFNGSLSSWSDYRFAQGFPFSGSVEHRFKFQIATGATIMNFSWNFPPELTGLIQDLINGTTINVPISGIGTYQLNNFIMINQLKLLVYYNNVVLSTENDSEVLTDYNLEQNYPNPFNPSTIIKFSISEATNVKLTIYNTLGEKIAELLNSNLDAGRYSCQWDAINAVTGIYVFELRTEKFVSAKKMILIK
jgi:hypothetical protein